MSKKTQSLFAGKRVSLSFSDQPSILYPTYTSVDELKRLAPANSDDAPDPKKQRRETDAPTEAPDVTTPNGQAAEVSAGTAEKGDGGKGKKKRKGEMGTAKVAAPEVNKEKEEEDNEVREVGLTDMMSGKEMKRLKRMIRRFSLAKQQRILARAAHGGSVDDVLADCADGDDDEPQEQAVVVAPSTGKDEGSQPAAEAKADAPAADASAGPQPVPGTSGKANASEAAVLRQVLFGGGGIPPPSTPAPSSASAITDGTSETNDTGKATGAPAAEPAAVVPEPDNAQDVITKSKTQLKKEERERRWREKMAEKGLVVPDPVPVPSVTATAAAAPVVTDSRTVDGKKGFSFRFNVAAAVESETELKIARLMAVDAGKDGFVPRRIWVCGMPHEYPEEVVREYWGYCGEIERCDLMTFSDSGNFNGTCFITFKTEQAFQAALACNGEELEGRQLRVEKCKGAAENSKSRFRVTRTGDAPGSNPEGSVSEPTKTPGYNVAYVGNLPFNATVEDIKEFFKDCNCTFVRLHTVKPGSGSNAGSSKGFAHVHFGDDDGLEGAVKLNDAVLMGRPVRVSYAQPKKSTGAAE